MAQVGEGHTEAVTVLFPGSEREMTVFWEDPETRSSPRRVEIDRAGTPWVLPGGITVRTRVAELNAANGGPFRHFGFNWDNGGALAGWDGGELEQRYPATLFTLTLAYDPATSDPEAVQKLAGDTVFSSDDPALEQIAPTVSRIAYLFPELMMRESLGPLHIGLPEAGVAEAIPAAPRKAPAQLVEATGEFVAVWTFPGSGVEVWMSSIEKTGAQQVAAIKVTAPSSFKTRRGIGIGSPEHEVAESYAAERNGGASKAGEQFVAGSVYGGLVFGFEDGKVNSIFLGAAAE